MTLSKSLWYGSVAVLLAILTGCGGGGGGGSSSTAGGDTPETPETPDTPDAEPEADSDGDGVVDSGDAEPANASVAGVITIRRDKAGVTGSGGTEIRRYSAGSAQSSAQLWKSSTDADSDGNPENLYSYNNYRLVTERLQDVNDDGSVDQTYSNTYLGSIISSRVASGSEANYEYTYVYSETGLLLQTDKDLNDDDVTDTSDIYTYVDNNALTPDLVRIDVDAITDNEASSIQYHYTDGLVSSVDYDDDGDGNVDKTVSYFYDVDDNLERVEIEETGDSNPDSAFNYDAEGLLTDTEEDTNSDGTVDATVTYTYTTAGKPDTIRYDDDDDGNDERVISYTYNAAGRPTVIYEDTDNDGNNDITITYGYNSAGRPTSIVKDAPGTVDDETVVFTYQGFLTYASFSYVYE